MEGVFEEMQARPPGKIGPTFVWAASLPSMT